MLSSGGDTAIALMNCPTAVGMVTRWRLSHSVIARGGVHGALPLGEELLVINRH